MKIFKLPFVLLLFLFFSQGYVFLEAQSFEKTNEESCSSQKIKTESDQVSEKLAYENGSIDIELVFVGDAGNKRDHHTKYGAVNDDFQIGKYDITAREYCAFLNAVAADDIYSLYDERMGLDPTVATIQRVGEAPNYSYFIIHDPDVNRGSLPITYVDYYSAMRFCNWLHNGQPMGEENDETTEAGAYTLNGNNVLVSANEGARWRLPTEDEWYKAAYYRPEKKNSSYWKYPTQQNELSRDKDQAPDANYLTQSDLSIARPFFEVDGAHRDHLSIDGLSHIDHLVLTPVGYFHEVLGPYKTYDMGGNVFQWTSSSDHFSACSDYSGEVVRGGCWKLPSLYLQKDYSRLIFNPSDRTDYIGFRVVAPIIKALPGSEKIENQLSTSTKDFSQNKKITASPASSNGLSNKEMLALVIVMAALLILAAWWLWPSLIEVMSSFELDELGETGIEMQKINKKRSDVASNVDDLLKTPESNKSESFMSYPNSYYHDTPWREKVKSLDFLVHPSK